MALTRAVRGPALAPQQRESRELWIDHREARVLHIHPDRTDEVVVTAAQREARRHPRRERADKEHPEDAKRFFHDVALSLAGAEPILVVGPSSAKLELVAYLHDHDKALEARIAGVKTFDHPTNGQAAAYAKEFFGVVVPRTEA